MHLVLKTWDTTVEVISSDFAMLKSKVRNFSVIFSLSIFNVYRTFSEIGLKFTV